MSADVSARATVAAPGRAAKKRRPGGGAIALPLLSGIAGLILWELAVRLWSLPPYLLPAPTLVAEVLVEYRAMLLKQLSFTAFAAAAGFFIALALGVTAGAAITASRLVDRMVYPWLVISHAIPKVVIAPLFIVWIGFGLTSEIIFTVVFTFFPIVVNTVTGLKSADLDLLTLVRSMGASPLQSLWKIRIPAALPSIFAGIKISATLAPVGAVIGEFVASNQGLGHMLLQATGSLETPLAFAAVFVISVFGILIWYLAELVERWSIPWHASQRGTILGN